MWQRNLSIAEASIKFSSQKQFPPLNIAKLSNIWHSVWWIKLTVMVIIMMMKLNSIFHFPKVYWSSSYNQVLLYEDPSNRNILRNTLAFLKYKYKKRFILLQYDFKNSASKPIFPFLFLSHFHRKIFKFSHFSWKGCNLWADWSRKIWKCI